MATGKGVHVMVGTRKGGYVLDGDRSRRKWKIRGPFHEGKDVFRMIADPRVPGRVYSAANSGWWGPMLYRSNDWGKKWTEVSLPGMIRGSERKPPESFPPKYAIDNVWQIAPGPADEPKTVWLGIDPANLYKSTDAGETWNPLPGLNDHPTRPKWNPGAGGMCLHTILQDPTNPHRMYVGISAAGTFRSEDGGDHWTPMNNGVKVSFLPEKEPEVGQCVHKVALESSDPSRLYRQDHDGIYVSRDHGDKWTRIGAPLKSDFGFNVVAPAGQPDTAYFVPLEGQSRVTFDGQLQVYRWSDKTKKWSTAVPKGTFPGQYGMHRDAMGADSLTPAGIYVGTTAGRLYWTPDAGKRWSEVPFQFPSIQSIQVAAEGERA